MLLSMLSQTKSDIEKMTLPYLLKVYLGVKVLEDVGDTEFILEVGVNVN
jgi:hypothetical protein